MDPTFRLVSIDIRREVQRIPYAELSFFDGNSTAREFPLSASGFFSPGKEVEIRIRTEGETSEETLFKGLATRQSAEMTGRASMATVGLKDAAIRLTAGRHSRVFRDQCDHQVIDEMVKQAGLSKGLIAKTEPKHPELTQFDCTDWDFILSRADVLGLLVSAKNGEISARQPDLSVAPSVTFSWGIDEIYDFEIEADGCHQFGAVESFAWSLEDQKLTLGIKAENLQLAQGLDAAKVANSLGFGSQRLSNPVPALPGEMAAWANARMARSRLALVRGRISVPGQAQIDLLDTIELKDFGEVWSGNTLVTGIRHLVDERGWRTDIQFGLSPHGFDRRNHIRRSPASGLLPSVNGLQIGLVAAFEEDPAKESRVKVVLPTVDEKDGPVWARVASPDAGKERGFFFRPEPGDEVVVGFLNDDPRHPVVLGGLFGSKNAPPSALPKPSAANIGKGLVTKKGTTLAFLDHDKASFLVETKNKNQILLDDDAETLTVGDQHGNSIRLEKAGIAIKSAGDLQIEASGNLTVKGKKVDWQ